MVKMKFFKKLVRAFLVLGLSGPANAFADKDKAGGFIRVNTELSIDVSKSVSATATTTSLAATAAGDATPAALAWFVVMGAVVFAGGNPAVADSEEVLLYKVRSADNARYAGKKLWQAVLLQSSVLAQNPELSGVETTITSVAALFDISLADLIELTLNIDHEINLAKAEGKAVSAAALAEKLFPSGFQTDEQRKAFNRMVLLASAQ